jgi:hypothetical protein
VVLVRDSQNAGHSASAVIARDERQVAAQCRATRTRWLHVERRRIVLDRPADRMRRVPDGRGQSLKSGTFDACRRRQFESGRTRP